MKLQVKRIPDCEFCGDEGVYDLDFQIGEEMRSVSHKCICQLESPTAVTICQLSPLNEIIKKSQVMTAVLETPVHKLAWSTGKIISTTLPSEFMRF